MFHHEAVIKHYLEKCLEHVCYQSKIICCNLKCICDCCRTGKYTVEMYQSDYNEKNILSLRIREITHEEYGKYTCFAKLLYGKSHFCIRNKLECIYHFTNSTNNHLKYSLI